MTTTTTTSNPGPAASLDEADVVDFLQANPDFLRRHPELLAGMHVPHEAGDGAVSLIEHQVAVLRERNERLDRRLASLLQNARDNERVGNRLLGLGRGLLEADSLDAVLSLVRDALLTEFSADTVAIRLIDNAGGSLAGSADGRFLPADAAELEPFAECLRKAEPQCGPNDLEAVRALLSDVDPQPRSAAIVPLTAGRPLGIIVLGSGDAGHFHPDMGTLFLGQLGDLVTAGVARYLERS